MMLLDALARRGLLTDADRARAADAVAASPDKPPHLTLLEKGFLKEEPLYDALAEEFGLEFVDLTKTRVEPEALIGDTAEARPPPQPDADRPAQRHPGRRHRRPVRRLRHRRALDRHRAGGPAGPRQPPRDRPAAATALRRRRRHRHGPDGGGRQGRPRTAGGHRGRRQRAGQAGPGSLGRPAGQPDPRRGRQRAGQRHPHRARGAAPSASATGSTACCRSRSCRRRSTASRRPSSAGSRSWPGSTSPRSGCRRTAASRCGCPGPRGGRPRLDHPDDPRRRHRHAAARQGPHGVQPQEHRLPARDRHASSASSSTGRTGSCSSPARPGPASPRRSTRRSTRSRTRRPRSSPSRTRSSTSSRASARSRRTPRSG